MLKTLITLLVAVATVATAAIAPIDYIEALRDNPIGMVLVTFLMWTSAIYIGYVIGNIVSGLWGQGDAGRAPALYWIDYFPSLLASFSLTLVGVWVALGSAGIVHGFPLITKVADVPNKLWVLLALVIFSWIDVRWLQGHKHKAAWQYITTQRAIVPAPALAPLTPVVPPAPPAGAAPVAVAVAAPTHVGTLGFTILLLLALAIFFAIIFSGTSERKSTSCIGAPSTAFVGVNKQTDNPLWEVSVC